MSKIIFIRNPKCATMSIRSVVRSFKVRLDEEGYHQTALEWKQSIDDYDDHFVFSVCRNPYDRLLSGWHFICKRKLDKHKKILSRYEGDFQKFVLNLGKDFNMKLTEVDMVTWPQWKWMTDNNNIIVDKVGRFEVLNNFWSELCKELSWAHSTLPKSNHTKHPSWRNVYNDRMKRIVYEQYGLDFKLFNYSK